MSGDQAVERCETCSDPIRLVRVGDVPTSLRTCPTCSPSASTCPNCAAPLPSGAEECERCSASWRDAAYVGQGALPDRPEPSSVGSVLDWTMPVGIQVAAFFGTQAYFNSGGGPVRVEMGVGWFLRLLIPSFLAYFVVIKPLLKAAVPRWWSG